MGGTRGSCVLSSTGDVLEMTVVSGVGGVLDVCVFWLRWCRWGVGRGLGPGSGGVV